GFSAAAACALLWLGQHGMRRAELSASRGVQSAGPSPEPLHLRLPAGGAVGAAPGAPFELLTAHRAERKSEVKSGTALFDVEPLREGESFSVVTPHAQVRVRGTVFSVEVDHGRTGVRVYEGMVSVNGAAFATFVLHAGQSYASDGGA